MLRHRQTVGARIRAARLALNYTQKAVADELGIAHTTLSNWERGTVPITLDDLFRLAEYFELPVAELVPSQVCGTLESVPRRSRRRVAASGDEKYT